MSLEIIDIPLEHFDFEATNEILRHALHWRKIRGITIKWTADLLKIREELQYLFPSKGMNGTPQVEAEVKFDANQLQEAFEKELQKFNGKLRK